MTNQKMGESQLDQLDLSLENIQRIAVEKYLQDLSLNDLEQIVSNNVGSTGNGNSINMSNNETH